MDMPHRGNGFNRLLRNEIRRSPVDRNSGSLNPLCLAISYVSTRRITVFYEIQVGMKSVDSRHAFGECFKLLVEKKGA